MLGEATTIVPHAASFAETDAGLSTAGAREQMNIVVVGHVDHGKSTVIGRLLADTGSLPEGKLEQVRAYCAQNARPFEYAFLLDALKDEQAQGITIDSARCFFHTKKRDYIIIDAPGHIEFLKNMVSGAARAEAALLVIDAHEGIRENSRRHGTMLSMLGVRQVVVLVNKMDLVNYDRSVFENISTEYGEFLNRLGLAPAGFVPISARDGVNIIHPAAGYSGPTVLSHLEAFPKERSPENQPFRFPVQDIYKFTADGDDRRIVAGTVETGTVRVGDSVVFLPSGKRSSIETIESFERGAPASASSGEAVGFTLAEELYIRPGEILCKAEHAPPHVSTRLRVNVFWMGKAAFIKGKRYKIKLATARAPMQLAEVLSVMDASDLSLTDRREQVERHDVAECIIEVDKPIAFDLAADMAATGRFVVVDNYEIAGGGIVIEALSETHDVLKDHVARREAAWESGEVALGERESRNGHRAKLVVLAGGAAEDLRAHGHALEGALFRRGCAAYYFDATNLDRGLSSNLLDAFEKRAEAIRRLGELARVLTDSGQITITTLADADRSDVEMLRLLNAPQEILTVALGVDGVLASGDVDLVVSREMPVTDVVAAIINLLEDREVLVDYEI